ncbi:MAG: (2Fe-2S) ferredoxin domain-containing protein [Armatimonadetes bacterium]|nr:(2Fe-2S) ferredoxin domain-containing protein [Armatimonadota bacterium]
MNKPVRVCCGARCGAEPNHKAIYAAIETAANRAGFDVVPTMCRALCTGGVTVILPNGVARKVSDTQTANSVLNASAFP